MVHLFKVVPFQIWICLSTVNKTQVNIQYDKVGQKNQKWHSIVQDLLLFAELVHLNPSMQDQLYVQQWLKAKEESKCFSNDGCSQRWKYSDVHLTATLQHKWDMLLLLQSLGFMSQTQHATWSALTWLCRQFSQVATIVLKVSHFSIDISFKSSVLNHLMNTQGSQLKSYSTGYIGYWCQPNIKD